MTVAELEPIAECAFPEHDGPIYLTGVSTPATRAAARLGLGLLVSPDNSLHRQLEHYSSSYYGADNACFSKGDAFDAPSWLSWLEGLPLDRCLFATLPDVVGDAAATIARSMPYTDQVRRMGFPAALVAQDGLEDLVVPWDDIDCLFLGGSTEWKLSPAARDLSLEARSRGKWVHMGRVNSARRVRIAATFGADSVDGTFLAFEDKAGTNHRRLFGWLDEVNVRPGYADLEVAS